MPVKRFRALFIYEHVYFYKTCVFKLKPYFLFIATKKMPLQFTFLSKMILYQFCAIKSMNFLPRQSVPYDKSRTTFYNLHFFYSHQKNVIVNKVIFYPKIVFIVSLYSWYISLYIAFIHSEKKNPKKCNFELLCIFYVSYDIQLLMHSKESRRFFFLYDCYVLGHYRRSKYNYQKMFFCI